MTSVDEMGKHLEPRLRYRSHAPLYWYEMSPAERKLRCNLTVERCMIDDEYYFVRGNIKIPIIDQKKSLIFTIWVSLGKENFERATVLWDNPARTEEEPYFAWLSSLVPGYLNTINLKTRIHTRQVGKRFRVQVEPTSHRLAVEQRDGITTTRLQEIAEAFEHSRKLPGW